MADYGDFKTELKGLLKGGENAIFKDDEDAINCRYWYGDAFRKNNNIVCFVNCEFCPVNIEAVHIHYNIKYWGSVEYNRILNKYGLCMEWRDSCNLYIYKDTD